MRIGLFNTKSLFIRLLAGLCILSLTLLGLVIFKSQIDTERLIAEKEAELIQMGESIVPRRFYVSQQILDASISQIVLNSDLISDFARRDRDALATKALKAFESLKRSDIDVYHFHLPNNRTFFRAHRPERYNDDLTEIRPMVSEINRTRAMIAGWEDGRHGFALRHLEPVFYRSEYIGAIEVGMFLEERMLNIWKRAVMGEWILCRFTASGPTRIAGTVEANCNIDASPTDTSSIKNKQSLVLRDGQSITQFLPLENFDGSVSFYIKRIIDSSQIRDLALTQRNTTIFYGLVVLAIASLVFAFLIRRILRPVNYLVGKAQKISEGRLDEPIETMTSDEIGLLASTMESMRQSLAAKTRQLEESNELFRTLSDTASEWILWLDPNGQIIYTSPSCQRFTGHDSAYLKANPDLIMDSIHPDDQRRWLQQISDSRKQQGALKREYRIINRHGQQKWIEHISSPVFDNDQQLLGIRCSIIDITTRKTSEERLEHLSFSDSLTGLYNRAYLQAAVEKYQHSSAYPITFIAADLDGLKSTNDSFGHSAGDELIQRAAEIMRSCMRKHDVLARFGGDEFVALMPDTTQEAGEAVVGRIREAVNAFNDPQRPVCLEISMGVACSIDGETDLMETMRTADLLMYQDKRRRKSQSQ
ncbi:diguanylate cyclase domain-containing protein [Wenzhouxiangella limi]|uniref:Diguanylate cyclase n=1 Tax=Wenzhouxiangella limi TaxID=2707351 RepID=A0A845V8N1_9GAMM|nr:diguanylate cyclase [Wenzhouxiangella limi]